MKLVDTYVIWYNNIYTCVEGQKSIILSEENKEKKNLASAMEIKQKNRKNVLRVIYDEKKISKAEISKRLGLSMPTIAQNLSELFDKELICINGTFDSTGGRKAKAIGFNADARYAIGIDITKNHISGVLINLYGEIIYSVRLRYRFEESDVYYKEIQKLVFYVMEKGQVGATSILGVGVSIPSIIAEDGKSLTYSPIIGAINIYEDLKKYIDFPYKIINDSNSGGYAELWHAKKIKNMIYLSLSNSIGGAVLMNNEIYYGDRMHSGEFGHMTLEINGRQCYCGKKGCVDAYCNAQNLSNLTDGDLGKFFELVEAGDERCVKELQQYMLYLAVTINNLYNILDCDVILGGYVGGYMEKYLDELRRMVSERCTFATDGSFIKPCFFKHESSAVGAALYFVDKFIEEI